MKTKAKHTQGPWSVGTGWIYHTTDERMAGTDNYAKEEICRIGISPRNDADARLIAAAPKMLAKLKRVLAMHECGNNGLYNGEAILSESVADELRYLIAEAEGR